MNTDGVEETAWSGWPNKPTWLVWSHIMGDPEAQQDVRNLFALYRGKPLSQTVALRNWVEQHTAAEAYGSVQYDVLNYVAADVYAWALTQVDWEYLATKLKEEVE